MGTSRYPIAARYPAELMALTGGELPPLALLSLQQQQHLLDDLQQLARIQWQTVGAMQALAGIDSYAAGIAYQTIQTAELMKLLYGSSAELEAFDTVRRAQFLHTLSQLVAEAHDDILSFLRGE